MIRASFSYNFSRQQFPAGITNDILQPRQPGMEQIPDVRNPHFERIFPVPSLYRVPRYVNIAPDLATQRVLCDNVLENAARITRPNGKNKTISYYFWVLLLRTHQLESECARNKLTQVSFLIQSNLC